MTAFDYTASPYPVRDDIGREHRAFWKRLAQPGSWWTGKERVAIATASRRAWDCRLCTARKAALSPNTVQGEHDDDGELPLVAVDAVHRIVTDQSRITQRYVDDNAAAGLSKPAYVELIGVVVAVLSIDEFHRALGLDPEPLPVPQPGDVSRYQPAMLREDIGFVPTVPPEGAIGNETDIWAPMRAANVVRALSLVPDALRDWRSLASAQYLSLAGMRNFVKDEARSLSRMQMELVAARVSAVNECFY